MAKPIIGPKAPSRAPVAPTTTPPATPEAAQAQAVALLEKAASTLQPAFREVNVTSAVRLSRLASDSVKHMLSLLAAPLTSGLTSHLIQEALDIEALLDGAGQLTDGPHEVLIGLGERVMRWSNRSSTTSRRCRRQPCCSR